MPISGVRAKGGRQGTVLTVLVIVTFVLLLGACAVVSLYPVWYRDMVYPGVSIAGIPLGGITREETRLRLQQAVDAFERQGVMIEGFGHDFILSPVVTAGEDPDLSYELIAYDIEAMTEEAYAVGRHERGGSARAWMVNALTAVGVRVVAVDMPARYAIDGERVRVMIGSEFGRFESPARDASLRVDAEGDVRVSPEQGGEMIDMERASADLAHALQRFSSGPVRFTLREDHPRMVSAQVRALLPATASVLLRAPFRLALPPETRAVLAKEFGFGAARRIPEEREISREMVAQWLTAAPDGKGSARIAFAYPPVADFLVPFVEFINRPAVDAKFEIRNGKVVEFQGSRDGRELDVPLTRERMEEAFLMKEESQAFIVFKEIKAKVRTAEVNDLGIIELLGVGRSNFSGSPQNRRHNISVGVAAVNGTLIAPHEEFSLLKTLGDIDAAAGYLPELVIKGNKTVPEYGGGLCQIGTTAFRTALSAGVPILERKNHSYRVRYYEPAGTDATIYGPKPDFRFLNDTGASLLFQARVEGDDAVFELWGSSDGRIATTTTPVIYNIVRPPPTKIVESTELKPGQKRCTESPHSGADASFTYTVTYPEGRIVMAEYKSHYRPWQEVCLVGVEKTEGEGVETRDTVVPSADAAGTQGE